MKPYRSRIDRAAHFRKRTSVRKTLRVANYYARRIFNTYVGKPFSYDAAVRSAVDSAATILSNRLNETGPTAVRCVKARVDPENRMYHYDFVLPGPLLLEE